MTVDVWIEKSINFRLKFILKLWTTQYYDKLVDKKGNKI